MMKNNAELKRYYRAIRSWLPCSQKQKKQILMQIQNSVESYLEQKPDADFPQLQEHFGEPQVIATSYVENIGTAEILRGLRIRKRIVTTVVTAVILILILWSSVVIWAALKAQKNIDGYIEYRIVPGEVYSSFFDFRGVPV